MSILTWQLTIPPATTPEYWLLFVDGFACTSLANQAPYKGVGTYSVDLSQLDKGSPVPTDGAAHAYSVALVGSGVVGPQSAAVQITLSLPVATITAGQNLPSVVWPMATSVTTQ